MKLNDYFLLEELVPKDVYTQFGDSAIWFVDNRLIEFLLLVRKYFGRPITVNNWHSGGNFQHRGFRPPDCTVGGKLSQHKFGRAVDFDVLGYSATEVRMALIGQKERWSMLTALEKDVTWVHADMRFTGKKEIILVGP